jgi:hypothetical protein
MLITREQLYIGVFNLLSTASGFNSYWRRFVPVQQLTSPQMPALMMRELREQRTEGFALPPKYTVDIDVGIICETQSDMSGLLPAAVINPLLDNVEAVLDPPPTPEYVVTLGLDGVSRIWIEGNIEILETVPGSTDRTFALIPVRVICQ